MEAWLETVLPESTPAGVVAYNFNLTDSIGWRVGVIGAPMYDPDDEDWSCEDVWAGDHEFELSKDRISEWRPALAYIAKRIGKFVARSAHPKAAVLRQSVAVCVGFVDGDLTRVWPAPTPLWPGSSQERARER